MKDKVKDKFEIIDLSGYVGSLRHLEPVPSDPTSPKYGDQHHCSLCFQRFNLKTES